MRCPNCGYVRKAEDIAPEWQCPSCQVVYEKVTHGTSYAHVVRNSMPKSVSKSSNGFQFSFSTILMVALLSSVLYFGYSIAKDPSAISSIAFSAESKSQLINNKKAELRAYEEALQRVEEQIAHDRANVGICPITKQPNQYILTQDPRPEVQVKIDQLKEDIRKLEGKL